MAAASLACAVAQAQETCGSDPATAANHSDNYLLDGDTAMHWATGLVWKRCLEGAAWNGGQCSGTGTAKSWNGWADADRLVPKTFVGQSSWGINAGLSQNLLVSGGWRMAYKNELLGITTDCSDDPKVNRVVFPDTPSVRTWSGSPHAYYAAQYAWLVVFRGGHDFSGYQRSDSYPTRLVRGGQAFAPLAPTHAQNAEPGASVSFAPLAIAPSDTAGQAWGGARIAGAGGPQFQINGAGGWLTQAIVRSGDTLTVRLTAPAALGTSHAATLTLRSGQTTGTQSNATSDGGESTALQETTATFIVAAHDRVDGACGTDAGTPTLTPPGAQLCSAGAAGSVGSSAADFAWTCAGLYGGGAQLCSAPRQYRVTPVVTGSGTVTPATAQAVAYGQTTQFTLAPAAGQVLASASGCGGTLAGAVFTTAPIQADCTVSVRFVPPPVDGDCGPAQGQARLTPPTADLCRTGQPGGMLSSGGQYTWDCAGEHGGTARACAAPWAPTGDTGLRASLDLPDAAGNNGWSLATAGVDANLPAPLPAGARSALRPLRLALTGGTAPQARVTVRYSAPVPAGAVYLKYGPSPDGLNCSGAACQQPHWYALPGAQFAPDGLSVSFTLTDGGAGDDDGAADRQISDPGMPVLLAAPPAGAQAIPALGAWGLAWLTLIAACTGMVARRKTLPK